MSGLGPLARAALQRAIETAISAGRGGKGVVVAHHVEHAINVVETAMIVDRATAEARAQDPHA